ncbi:MAG: TetR/AcrR family transcriptional regulator [Marinilabiliales bacterium]|nr:MAG: TetR/AcrR family transcriptional regulator [Marinilabiliales bacterium]
MTNKKDLKRENIITAAGRVFGKHGFREARMENIAEEADMGKSSLYYYFISKEELFEAVVEREAENLKNEIILATKDIIDPYKRMKKYVIARMNAFNESINLYTAVKTNYLDHLPFIEKVRSKYDKEEMKMVESILKDGVRNNRFKLVNTELATVAIVTAIKGLEYNIVIREGPYKLEQQVEQLLMFLFYGIVKRH